MKDAVGRHLTETFRIVDATTRKVILDPMAKAASENLTGKLPSNCVLIHRDGHEVFIEDSVAPIHDREGKVTGAVIVFRDVSAARAQSEQMAHLAEHDSLTGLPNRLLFCDRVGQALSLARRHGGQAAVLFLDLDGFKHINDSLGHAAGDEFLKSIAKRLLACVRDTGYRKQAGGDEFVSAAAGCTNSAQDAAMLQPEECYRQWARFIRVDGRELHVTASIGISVFPDDGLDAETLIKNADTAMYLAKKNGRQCCQFFRKELDVPTVELESTEERSARPGTERIDVALPAQSQSEDGSHHRG
jgi:diguanylate cyclase (GGDEF)-like protein